MGFHQFLFVIFCFCCIQIRIFCATQAARLNTLKALHALSVHLWPKVLRISTPDGIGVGDGNGWHRQHWRRPRRNQAATATVTLTLPISKVLLLRYKNKGTVQNNKKRRRRRRRRATRRSSGKQCSVQRRAYAQMAITTITTTTKMLCICIVEK